MKIEANSPEEYISKLPEERQEVMSRLRNILNTSLPSGFEEGMSYGMIGYYVPHSIYPDGYHCTPELPLPFINLASQKNHIGFYHMGIYADPILMDWFVNEYPNHAKRKLDMGKSCIRFKKMDDIPYDLLQELVKKMTVERWIEIYEQSFKK